MGGATRFMTLLTTPFPPLRPSLHLLRRRISTSHLRPITLSRPSKIKTHAPQLVSCFHSQPNNTNTNTFSLNSAASQQQQHHPWPEWTNFLNMLSNAPADNKVLQEDAFVVYEQLPDHFVRAAASCLAFARARPNLLGSLSRRDIEAVVSNGTPFLFKSAMDTARRMRAFLASDVSSASEVDIANTVDLMKYILSYASNPTVSYESNGLYSRELVDSSVRNLLHELVTVSCGAPVSSVPAFDDQFSGRPRQTFRPLGRHVEMKRGDWICTKCNFMNFAKNMSCLECEEPRPRKQLTGGEWECSQCNFFNYGGNSVCLRCDCRRPGAPLFHSMNSNSGSGYNRDNPYMGKQNVGMKVSPSLSQTGSSDFQYPQGSNSTRVPFAPLPTNTLSWGDQTSEMNDGKGVSSSESQNLGASIQFTKDSTTQTDKDKEQAGKTQNWFKKIAELHNVKDLPNAVSDEDFPEIMPMRKGENRFVVSKKKDRSLTSPKYKRQVAMEETNSTSFPTFVPFPPGYFAKKDTEQPSVPDSPVKAEPTGSDESNDGLNTSSGPRVNYQTSSTHNVNINSQTERFSGKESAFDNSNSGALSQLPENESFRSSWAGPSLEGSAVKETDPLDMSEEAKAERWFKRVAQIKDISELSQIPDEDFPSIMPMRKGVNRFVVSKRKTPLERRLTNQQYRRNLPIVSTDPFKKESDNN